MVKIHGVDSMIVNQIKDKAEKRVIFESDKTKVTEEKDEKEERRQKKFKKEDLEEAVTKLNKLMEDKDVSLLFRIIEKENKLLVEIIDEEKNEVLFEIKPYKLFQLKNNLHNVAGIIIDESI